MKRIIKNPAVYRIICSQCGCKFEYDNKEVKIFIYHNGEEGVRTYKGVSCPNCEQNCEHTIEHNTTTPVKMEDTMNT